MIKSTLAPAPAPLGMRIHDTGLQFGPPPEPPASYPELARAADLLRDLLADGPRPGRGSARDFQPPFKIVS